MLPPMKRNNHVLTRQLVVRLVCSAAEAIRSPHPITSVLARDVGARRVAGVILREGCLRLFVTTRRPSQVEFDVTLRLALPERQ